MGYRYQRGAALVFALLLSIVFGALGVGGIYLARYMIDTAEAVAPNWQEKITVASLVDEVVFSMAGLSMNTLAWRSDEPKVVLGMGEVYPLDERYSLFVEDIASRLTMTPFVEREWRAYFSHFGYGPIEINSIIDKMLDWADTDRFKRLSGSENGIELAGEVVQPRNSVWQFPLEMLLAADLPPEFLDNIRSDVSEWSANTRRPLNGNAILMSAYLSPEQVLSVQRRRETLDIAYESGYQQMQDVDPTLVNKLPSGWYRLNFKNNTKSYTVEVNLRGNAFTPYYISHWQ